MKKRKLNSKNPKYWDKSQLNEVKIKKKVLINDVKGVKIHAVWYDHQNYAGVQVNSRLMVMWERTAKYGSTKIEVGPIGNEVEPYLSGKQQQVLAGEKSTTAVSV